MSLLRTYAAFLAGTMKMHWRRFLLFNAAGGIVWACAYGLGFYYFGSVLEALRTPVDIALVIVAVLLSIGAILFIRRKEKPLDSRPAVAESCSDRPRAAARETCPSGARRPPRRTGVAAGWRARAGQTAGHEPYGQLQNTSLSG